MNRKPILLTLAFALITILSQAQNAILKGQVTTSDNQPLEFVNVGIKGLSKGSTTDLSEVTRGFLARAGLDDLLHNSFEGNSTGKSTMISAFISDVINIRSNLSVMIFG